MMYKVEDEIKEFRRIGLDQENFEYLKKVKEFTRENKPKYSYVKLLNNLVIYARQNKIFDKIIGKNLKNL